MRRREPRRPPRAVLPRYLLPKQLLTHRSPARRHAITAGDLTTAAIRRFVARYGVDMAEAANPTSRELPDLQRVLHARALKPGARPAPRRLAVPVDGAISQFGAIERATRCFQAKGHGYSTTALVGGDAALAARFENGQFATLYLSPRDYHRIHMPCAGRLTRMIHVPGDLFSVNLVTARACRAVRAQRAGGLRLRAGARPVRAGAGGATIVGSMATTWHMAWSIRRGTGTPREWSYRAPAMARCRSRAAPRWAASCSAPRW